MGARLRASVVLLCVSASLAANTMVLVDDLNMKSTHSIFFDDIRGRGHNLVIKKADDPTLSLKQHGEFIYDNLIIFAPAVEEFGGTVDVASVLEFVDSGHNVLLAVTSEVGDPVREIASESGINFDTENNAVIDHMSFDRSDFDGDHTLVVADKFNHVPIILGKRPIKSPVLFEGIGASLDPDNRLVMHLITASPTAYSHNAEKPVADKVEISGTNTVLLAALQARNNARMVFSGSFKFFSNEFFTSPVTKYQPAVNGENKMVRHDVSSNRQVAVEVSSWTFGERGLLRVGQVKHWKKGDTSQLQPKTYRIMDEIGFSMRVEENVAGKWVPFSANDVQLEFAMLDPYVRTNLIPGGNGTFTASFKAPDVYGVFQFKVNYWRPGYGSFSVAEEVVVRPFRHDEFERFISSAYPYYASSFSMMAGSFIFGAVVLYYKKPSKDKLH